MRISIHILLLLLPLACLAQKEDRVWVFGYNAGIDFNDTANPVNFRSNCTNFKTTAGISSPSGELLFYVACDFLADTCTLMDRDHMAIPGTDSIDGARGYATSSAIISFPQDSVYYFFYLGTKVAGCQLSYCQMVYFTKLKQQSDGSFSMLGKNVPISNELAFEKLGVVKHANGRDWWLVVPMLREVSGYCTNKVFTYFVGKDTIGMPTEQHVGKLKCGQYKNGDMVFSPDGNRVAITFNEDKLIEIYDFDRCNGTLFNPRTIDSTLIDPFFTCFSGDGRTLYVTKGGNLPGYNAFVQYYLDTNDVLSTRQILWEDSTQGLLAGGVRLAPDGRVYFSSLYRLLGIPPTVSPYSRNLGVVHSPNEVGAACDFRPFSYYLGDSALATGGLPNMPNYNLGPLPIYQASAGVDTFYCVGDSTIKALPIGGDSVPHIIYQWQPAPGIDNLTARTQLVLPTQSRWYYVTLTDTNYVGPSCNSRVDSVYIEVRACTTVGITALQTLQAKLYPNPTTGSLTVELPNGQSGNLELYNLLGQSVFNTTINGTATLQMELPKGVYIYRIEQRGQQLIGKLLVE